MTDDDVATVRAALAGMEALQSGASAAFERILAELARLQTEVDDLDTALYERQLGEDL